MTAKKSTKRALISSLLILAMCFTMLAGTTFAWFTDSVTSSNNRIVSGKLDIDLVKYDANATTTDKYVSIAGGTGDIFGNDNSTVAQNDPTDTLWEPGKTQIVFLGVKNLGNLWAKYRIIINVADEGLVGSLEYAYINGATAAAYAASGIDEWKDITDALDTQVFEGGKGDLAAGATVAATQGSLAPAGTSTATSSDADYFALAVHMKEDAGNEYQEKNAIIDIAVVATQDNVEEDAFDADYDKDAELPAIKAVSTPAELTAALTDPEVKVVELKADVTLADTVLIDSEKTIDLGDKEIVAPGMAFEVTNGSLTVKNGKVTSQAEAFYVRGLNGEHAELTIGKDVEVVSNTDCCVYTNFDSTINVAGKLTSNGTYAAIQTNGDKGTDVVINITEGAEISAADEALYIPKCKELNISGGTITGLTGVEIRAGKLTITGGTITGTGNPFGSQGNGNGSTTEGAGVAFVQHNTYLPIEVTITGGTISGTRAVYEANLQNSSDADLAKISASITGGTFIALNGGERFHIEDSAKFGSYTNTVA